jgi:outer membrane lipoprotein SlyB
MRIQAARTRMFRGGMWMLPLLPALLLGAGGCIPFKSTGKEKPGSEIVIRAAEYGTITQITSAPVKDNETRRGNIAITVDTDDGRIVIVTQPEDDVYTVGDRVRVIRDGRGFIRVRLAI